MANQDQSFRANEHSKNRWNVDSVQFIQEEHIDGILQPLIF